MAKMMYGRMAFCDAVQAARALRSRGMAWTDIGKELGYSHNKLRNAINDDRLSMLDAATTWGTMSGPLMCSGSPPGAASFSACASSKGK